MTLDEAIARDSADPLAFARDRFSLPDGTIYLDGNSLGALPRATAAHISRTVEEQWGVDLITSWTRHEWIEQPTRVGARIAGLIGAGADEVLACDSTSVNLFKLAAAALGATGRRVILTEEENFPTDQYVAQGIARLFPVIEFRRAARGELVDALDDDVALLMLTQVDYRGGHRHDMAKLSAAARAVGALSLWDLSHSAGVLDVQLRRDGADLAVGCGYKYLNGGPGAPAFLFVRSDLQGRLENPIQGWMGHASPFAFDSAYCPAPGIARFLSGTPSILALAALDAGLDTFTEVDMATAEAKAGALGNLFIAEVKARCPALALASPREATARGGHVCFAHDDGYAIMQALIEHGVIGDFRAPDLMRFGFAPLTTRFADVVEAATRLAEVIDSGAYRDPRHAERKVVT